MDKASIKKAIDDMLSISYRLHGCAAPNCLVCAENERIIKQLEEASKALATEGDLS